MKDYVLSSIFNSKTAFVLPRILNLIQLNICLKTSMSSYPNDLFMRLLPDTELTKYILQQIIGSHSACYLAEVMQSLPNIHG